MNLRDLCRRYVVLKQNGSETEKSMVLNSYISVLRHAIQKNFDTTESRARSIVCSDVISNIFIIMLRQGTSPLSEIEKTCAAAATLYTESLKLLQYCLRKISLKQITDIKRLVYMKTVGMYPVKDEMNSFLKCDSDLLSILRNTKTIIQSFIICTVLSAHTHVDEENKSKRNSENSEKSEKSENSEVMLNAKHLHIFLTSILQIQTLEGDTTHLVHDLVVKIQDIVSALIMSNQGTTTKLSSVLLVFSLKIQIWIYIFEKTKNIEITEICFESLDIPDDIQDPLKIRSISDIRKGRQYNNVISQLK